MENTKLFRVHIESLSVEMRYSLTIDVINIDGPTDTIIHQNKKIIPGRLYNITHSLKYFGVCCYAYVRSGLVKKV